MVCDPQYPFAAIILAAGSSTRMGQPKLLLPWGRTTVLGHLIESWEQLGAAQVAVVTSGTDRLIDAELNRVNFPPENQLLNSNPERGMFSSIQCAARWGGWKAGILHWAIVLGDQPHLRLEGTLQRLVNFSGSRPERICQPSRNGKAKHPVFLPRRVFTQLAKSESESLKDFLRSDRVELLEMEDPGLDLDIDHPSDYDRALRLFFSGQIRD